MAYQKFFTISFDDGLEQDKRLIELMKKYGLQGTFNLNGGLFGIKRLVARVGDIGFMDFPETAKIRRKLFKYAVQQRIPEDEIRQVYQGFEVASHAFKHEPLALLKADRVTESLDRDVATLEKIVGYPIKGHAYPGGMSSATTEACLREKGFLYGREAFSSSTFAFPENPYHYRPTCSHAGKNTLELMEQFIAAKPEVDDLLLMMWGHGYELDYGTERNSWQHIESIFEKIAGRQDIVYCTNVQAFEQHQVAK
jgi:peptidoglycan/xylan/chitin deacetylase (PgdA/CDA1 family)